MIRSLTFMVLVMAVGACAPPPAPTVAPGAQNSAADEAPHPPTRIVSLDYCADQYLLKLGARESILALSPDARASFSYMRDAAKGLPRVRPSAEAVLALKPDLILRTYGGGAGAIAFFERIGVPVLNIPYAPNFAAAENAINVVARGLGRREHGDALVRDLQRQLGDLHKRETPKTALYITSKGAIAGRGTTIDDLFTAAGLQNFSTEAGWGAAPLERLTHERPNIVAAGFFDTHDAQTDHWSAARHPVVARMFDTAEVIAIPGALTACGAWPLVDAATRLGVQPTPWTPSP